MCLQKTLKFKVILYNGLCFPSSVEYSISDTDRKHYLINGSVHFISQTAKRNIQQKPISSRKDQKQI